MNHETEIPKEITIPEGFKATIKGDKIILTRKESEDEKVRKELIEFVKSRGGFKQEYIAWLEKQGKSVGSSKWHSVLEEPEEMRELLCKWDSDDSTWHDIAFYHSDSKTFWNGRRRVWNITKWCYIDELFENQGELKSVDKMQVSEKLYEHIRNTCACIEDALSSKTFADAKDYLLQANYDAQFAFDMLEKQGENPFDKDKPKFKVGDLDAEKKELKKIEDEEYNGEDYGIDGLWHAINILERTLGSVDGYQSDDGILEHKCAITAVKKLYKQKPAEWSEKDEVMLASIISDFAGAHKSSIGQDKWLKSLKDRVQSQPKQEWSEEDENTIKVLMNIIRKSEMIHPVIYTDSLKEKLYDWLKSIRPQKQWKPTKEQMEALNQAKTDACGKPYFNALASLYVNLQS